MRLSLDANWTTQTAIDFERTSRSGFNRWPIARSQPALARRARVVLACAQGLANKSVAKKLRCSLGMVGKWRSRFLKTRLEGLYDEPRPGAPRKVTDAMLSRS